MPEKKTALRKRIVPSVPLVLELEDADGAKFIRSFSLSFGMRAIAEIEERTGLSVLRGEIWKKLNAKTIAVMFWAAALESHPEFDTGDDTGLQAIFSYLDVANIGMVGDKLWESFFASLPARRQEEILANAKRDGAQGDAPDPTKAAAEDGSSSGPSPVTTSASASASSAG